VIQTAPQRPTLFLGIDPDMHDLAVASVCTLPSPVEGAPPTVTWSVGCVRIPKAITGLECVPILGAELMAAAWKWRNAWDKLIQNDSPVVAIETPMVYRKETKNPEDIIHLACVAGAAACAYASQGFRVEMVEPQRWKGQVPKGVHQKRTLDALGLTGKRRGGESAGYMVPDDPAFFGEFGASAKDGDWKHLLDAVGLALWASKGCKRK